MKVAAVLPALDEAASLPGVLSALPPSYGAVVVDGGSTDGTAERARKAGAVVVTEARRGYGLACETGAQAARDLGAEIVVFLDAGGTVDPADVSAVVAPVLAGVADLALGSRVLGDREPGALGWTQRGGNALACAVIRARTGQRYTDLAPIRALRLTELVRLDLRQQAHGWPVELQVRAATRCLRVVEVPIRARRRRSGRSKVSGSLRGSIRAGAAILRVVLESSR